MSDTTTTTTTTTASSTKSKQTNDEKVVVFMKPNMNDVVKKEKEHYTGISLDTYCEGIELALELASLVLTPRFCAMDSNGQIIDVKQTLPTYHRNDDDDDDDDDDENQTPKPFNMSSEIWEHILSEICSIPPFELMEKTFPTDILGRPQPPIVPKRYSDKFKVVFLTANSVYSGVSNYPYIESVFKTLIDADELMKSNPNITNINHSISRLCREMHDKIVFKMNDHNLTKQGKVIETFAKVDEMLNCTFKPKRSHNCIEQSNKVV
jgi:hypothetical protein